MTHVSSAIAYLPAVRVPTLCISADDDPSFSCRRPAVCPRAGCSPSFFRGHRLGRPHRVRGLAVARRPLSGRRVGSALALRPPRDPMLIGIFDSGFGGLSIYRSIRARLPQYDYVYLGDNARTPYGNRSFEAIYRFTTEGIEHLFARGCKLVIIACNTASAKALRTIQQKDFRSATPTVAFSGLSAPRRRHWPTIRASGPSRFGPPKERWRPGALPSSSASSRLACASCRRLVRCWCRSWRRASWRGRVWSTTSTSTGPRRLAEARRASQQPIAALLLACTHYPLLIRSFEGGCLRTWTSSFRATSWRPAWPITSPATRELESALSRGGTQRFLTTDRTEGFDRLAESFLGHGVESEKVEI